MTDYGGGLTQTRTYRNRACRTRDATIICRGWSAIQHDASARSTDAGRIYAGGWQHTTTLLTCYQQPTK
jgi:hypothetical protein